MTSPMNPEASRPKPTTPPLGSSGISTPRRVHTATCAVCSGVIGWIDCPTGGWWAHEQHPADDHDARLGTAEVTLPAAMLDDLETWLLARRWTLRQRPMDARAWYAVPVIGEPDGD